MTFGTGKLDNIDGTVNDDFNDEWIMSAFNVADRVVEVEPVDSSLLSEVTVDSATYEVTPQAATRQQKCLRTAGSISRWRSNSWLVRPMDSHRIL